MKLPEITVSLPYCYLQKEKEGRGTKIERERKNNILVFKDVKLQQIDYINLVYQTLLEEVH